jgi:hypothetical protein
MYLRAYRLVSQDPLRARALFETLQRTYPQSRYHWGASFNIARIMMRQGDTDAAVSLFNTIIQNSGDPLLIKAARSYLSEMDIKGVVAQFKPEVARSEPQAEAAAIESPAASGTASGVKNEAPVSRSANQPVRRATRPAQPAPPAAPRALQAPTAPPTPAESGSGGAPVFAAEPSGLKTDSDAPAAQNGQATVPAAESTFVPVIPLSPPNGTP